MILNTHIDLRVQAREQEAFDTDHLLSISEVALQSLILNRIFHGFIHTMNKFN